MIGYSIRSIASWEGGKPLSESARQKLTETERLRIALSGEKETGTQLVFEGKEDIRLSNSPTSAPKLG